MFSSTFTCTKFSHPKDLGSMFLHSAGTIVSSYMLQTQRTIVFTQYVACSALPISAETTPDVHK